MVASTPGVGQKAKASWFAAIAQMLNGTAGGSDYTDTGWIALSGLVAGWTSSGASARQIGNRVYLRGILTNAAFSGSFTTAATLPTGIDPPGSIAAQFDASGAAAGTTRRAVQITTGGAVQVFATATTGASLYLTFTYLTD